MDGIPVGAQTSLTPPRFGPISRGILHPTDRRAVDSPNQTSARDIAARSFAPSAAFIGVRQSDMATGYMWSRLFASGMLSLTAVLLALSWRWTAGWLVAGFSLVVFLDAVGRLRRGSPQRVMVALLIDVTATGSAVLFSDLPHPIAVAPFFYDLVSAVFALPRRSSFVITCYVAIWSFVVASFDVLLAGSNLTRNEQDVLTVIAVLVYLGATFLMTTMAAVALQERQRLHDDLREKESRLQAVVDGTPIVLYAIDNDGIFTLSEGPGLSLLGLRPGQVVGLHVAEVYGDNPEVLDMVNTALVSDTDTVAEVVVEDVAFAVHHRPQFDPAGTRTGTVGVAIDVTAEATYRRELENQIRSRDEFVASVSHELRTPLSVVYGLGEELRTNSSDLAPHEIAELHTLLSQQAGEVVAIVEDLLVAARADIDRLVVVAEPVDIGAEVSSVLQPMAVNQPVAVTAPDEPVVAWCDGSRSRQILRNLLLNAVRHGGEHIELDYRYANDQVVVEVRDDGPGVPREDEARIFDAYHRSTATGGNPASIGLGLTVAQKLARLMEGELSYARRDGWSLFRLLLPSAAGRQAVPNDSSPAGDPLHGARLHS